MSIVLETIKAKAIETERINTDVAHISTIIHMMVNGHDADPRTVDDQLHALKVLADALDNMTDIIQQAQDSILYTLYVAKNDPAKEATTK